MGEEIPSFDENLEDPEQIVDEPMPPANETRRVSSEEAMQIDEEVDDTIFLNSLQAEPETVQVSRNLRENSTVFATMMTSAPDHPAFLETAVVQAAGLGRTTVPIRLLFDTGAQQSIIIMPVGAEPTILISVQPKKLSGVAGGFTTLLKHRVVLTLTIGKEVECQRTAPLTVQPLVCESTEPWATFLPSEKPEWLQEYRKRLADPEILSNQGRLPFVLILGVDDVNHCTRTLVKRRDGLFLRQTQFGITVSGKYRLGNSSKTGLTIAVHNESAENISLVLSEEAKLSQQLLRQSQLEYDLIHGSTEDSMQISVHEFLEEYEKGIIQDATGRCIAPLPRRKYFSGVLSNNRDLGRRQSKSILKILNRHDELTTAYCAIVDDWIEKGIIVPISEEDRSSKLNSELPHHPVVKMTSTSTKIRPVVNGSAKEPGFSSINEYLEAGPNILPPLQDVLLRFRKFKYFIMADIEKAFLQIKLPPQDVGLMVFRWFNYNEENQKWEPHFYTFAHLIWGIICAPFMLNCVVRFLLKGEATRNPTDESAIEEISQNIYVDDVLSMDNDEERTKEKAELTKRVLEQGKFRLTKYRSFPQHLATKFDLEAETIKERYKILGIRYFPSTDQIAPCFDNLHAFDQLEAWTKAHAAGIGARIFDPHGLLCPFTLKAKLLRQDMDLHRPTLSWKHRLTKEEIARWKEYIQEADLLEPLKFPRQLPTTIDAVHVFSDASKIALGSAVYVIGEKEGKKTSQLLQGKNNVVPVKKRFDPATKEERALTTVEINKLELSAAALAAETGASLITCLKLQDSDHSYWTDNENVLRWIKNGPCHPLKFVNSRVERILKVTKAQQWHHIPTKINPADLASRGLGADKLLENSLWFNGPEFLLQDRDKWPEEKAEFQATLMEASEENVERAVVPYIPPQNFFHGVLTNENVSSKNMVQEGATWTATMRRATAIIRFQRRIRAKVLKQEVPLLSKSQLCLMAQISIAFEATEIFEPELLKQLRKPKVKSNLASKILENNLKIVKIGRMETIVSISRQTPLGTIQDEVLEDREAYERLRRTDRRRREEKLLAIIKTMQYPPKDHDLLYQPTDATVTKKLLKFLHFQTAHGSTNRILVQLHLRYWIPRARTVAKKTVKNCHLCTLRTAKFIKQPEAPLPNYRTLAHRAFQTIGVDFTKTFAPIPGVRGLPCILVITCTYYRVSILVPVIGQSHKSFLWAYDAFRNTRSAQPSLIVSDSAGAFKLAYEELKKRVHEQLVAWKFNLPRTPWWGGFFERIMAIIDNAVTALFEEFKFESYQQFVSTVALLERLVNSRPILEVFDGREDVPITITPNQFINPQAEENFNLVLADLLETEIPREPSDQRDLLRRREDQADFFRRLVYCFQNQYFLQLRKFHNTPRFKRGEPYELKVGDSVLIKPEFDFKLGAKRRRLIWKRGRVTELLRTARDGVLRAVKLKVPQQDGTFKEVGPVAVQKLAPLEIVVD